MARTRWYIERTPGNAHSPHIEDVGAESLEIHVSGALIFTVVGDEMLIYAPGTWVSIYNEVED